MSDKWDLARLSWDDRILRCYFKAIEALLDRVVIEHVLIDSMTRFVKEKTDYPFVRPAELKPGGIAPTTEHALHNTALILFLEQQFPRSLKPYIRVRRSNELLARNLQRFTIPLPDSNEGIAALREITSPASIEALKPLLNLDQALLVQRKAARNSISYELSHFHVRIDAVLDAVIEDYGLELRYISRDLYEQGEDYAALLEQKFYEQFGMKTTASGRRTAAVVAQRLLLKEAPGLNVIYVGSSEARCVYKIHQDGTLVRFVLVPLDSDELKELTSLHGIDRKALDSEYLINSTGKGKAAVFMVRNSKSAPALPPTDRKLRREISSAERWISTELQLILPLPSSTSSIPLEWNWIYRSH